jgi:aminopeptidase
MITKEKIEKCAESIVTGMNLKKGEAVLIRGGTYAQDLLEEVGLLCYKKGASPFITATSDNYSVRVFKEVPAEYLEIVPKHYLGAVKEMDGIITIEPFKDPAIQEKFPMDKLAARQKSLIPVRKIIYGEEGKGKKWTYAGWPTREAAKFYKVSYDTFEHLIVDGIMVHPSTLRANCAKIVKKLKGKKTLRITDAKGTDFTCKIEGRRINEDDGVIDDNDIAMNDLGNNLPAGEVFIAPHENFGEGTLFCPITIDRFTNKLIEDVTLHFKNGKLLLEECTAKRNGEQMIESFKRCLEIDKNEKEIRTTNIAELGIGVNPAIDTAIGYILTDEKLIGSVHVAFGNNFSYGGASKSSMHWDFVSHPSATIEVVETGEIIMQDGEVL